MIRQYLKSPTNHSLPDQLLPAVETFRNRSDDEEWNNHPSTESATIGGTLTASILLNGDSSFPESDPRPVSEETETEATGLNSTRYCDDCLSEEVCVALVDEEVPTCRTARDPEDPTGCAGFCLINKQKCHRLDVDAFRSVSPATTPLLFSLFLSELVADPFRSSRVRRCVEMEHYCLDDEWTCLNTLCIPLEKHCDGHMNCYDHSDEQNCGA